MTERIGRQPITMNMLYYGDNLKILRQYIPSESIDLIYLDPPFNSNGNYNVLLAEPITTSSRWKKPDTKT